MVIIAMHTGRILSWISKAFGFGAGATWPGEIALRLDPFILPKLLSRIRKGIIVVAGTNGKTTTSLMITKILEDQGFRVLHNKSGANLLNGIVSSFFADSGTVFDYAVFEVDENSLPRIITEVRGQKWEKENKIIILLNLFRDQLDRYGEVDTIAKHWMEALKNSNNTTFIINGDDPHLAFIGEKLTGHVSYFGLDDKQYYLPKMQHATDTIFCPSCGSRLVFHGVYFSHLGNWECNKCKLVHPTLTLQSSDVQSPIPGVYNIYNTLAATLVTDSLRIRRSDMQKSLSGFIPAFGRMETLTYRGKTIRILLSKNPTGFNESLRTVLASKQKGPMLLLLNDRIPDGTDVSWIWDVDMEQLDQYLYPIVVSGDRALDMALRLKYAFTKSKIKNQKSKIQMKYQKYEIKENLKNAVTLFIQKTKENETGWVLATYSAMLDVRKILTGKKIL